MFELFGLVVALIVLVPVAILAGVVVAALWGVSHILGFAWQVFWGVFGVLFGLVFLFGMLALGGLGLLAALF